MRDPILDGTAAGVEPDPEGTEPQRQNSGKKPHCALRPGHRLSPFRAEANPPCPHSGGLPSMSPEPAKIQKNQTEESRRIEPLTRLECLSAIEWQQQRGGDEQHTAQENGIVNPCHHAPTNPYPSALPLSALLPGHPWQPTGGWGMLDGSLSQGVTPEPPVWRRNTGRDKPTRPRTACSR